MRYFERTWTGVEQYAEHQTHLVAVSRRSMQLVCPESGREYLIRAKPPREMIAPGYSFKRISFGEWIRAVGWDFHLRYWFENLLGRRWLFKEAKIRPDVGKRRSLPPEPIKEIWGVE